MANPDIDKMLEWKERRISGFQYVSMDHELNQFRSIWNEKSDFASEMSDLVPTRIVTFIEVFVREVIRALVDRGAPYLERAEDLAKGAKIDFVLLSGLQGRKLSVGDLIAHNISISEPVRVVA